MFFVLFYLLPIPFKIFICMFVSLRVDEHVCVCGGGLCAMGVRRRCWIPQSAVPGGCCMHDLLCGGWDLNSSPPNSTASPSKHS